MAIKVDVWKKSINFVKHIDELTSKLFDVEKFGLTSQMRRAAILIPGDIAEWLSDYKNRYGKNDVPCI